MAKNYADPRAKKSVPAAPTRRAVMLVVAVAGATSLSACQSEPGSSSPNPRDPSLSTDMLDADILVQTVAHTSALRRTAKAWTPADPAVADALAHSVRILQSQQTVLTRLLKASTEAPSQPSSEPPAEQDSATASAPIADLSDVNAATFAAALTDSSTSAGTLADVSALTLPTLLSAHAARAAAAQTLGHPVTWGELTGPLGQDVSTMLAALHQAVYGLEITASQSADSEREAYREALGALRPLVRRLTKLAGPTAPAAPLGYSVTSPLSDEQDRRDFARELIDTLPAAVIAESSAYAGNSAAINGTLAVLSGVVSVGLDMGSALPSFPGLTVPNPAS